MKMSDRWGQGEPPNKPEEEWLVKLPKEAISWSKRSKTDNSKSEAMGLGGVDREAGEAEEASPPSAAAAQPTSAEQSLLSPPGSTSGLVRCKWEGRFGVDEWELEFSSTDDDRSRWRQAGSQTGSA